MPAFRFQPSGWNQKRRKLLKRQDGHTLKRT
jgi:hypothetical protein